MAAPKKLTLEPLPGVAEHQWS